MKLQIRLWFAEETRSEFICGEDLVFRITGHEVPGFLDANSLVIYDGDIKVAIFPRERVISCVRMDENENSSR